MASSPISSSKRPTIPRYLPTQGNRIKNLALNGGMCNTQKSRRKMEERGEKAVTLQEGYVGFVHMKLYDTLM